MSQYRCFDCFLLVAFIGTCVIYASGGHFSRMYLDEVTLNQLRGGACTLEGSADCYVTNSPYCPELDGCAIECEGPGPCDDSEAKIERPISYYEACRTDTLAIGYKGTKEHDVQCCRYVNCHSACEEDYDGWFCAFESNGQYCEYTDGKEADANSGNCSSEG